MQGDSPHTQKNNDIIKIHYPQNFTTDKKVVAQKEQNEQTNLDFNIIAYCVPLKKEDSHPDQLCTVCQQNKPLIYTYRTYDSKDGYACFECGDKIRCHLDRRD